MSFSDETLRAFADGELDAATRHAIEEAMRDDRDIAQRVAQYKALRSGVLRAFAPILDEPLPQRLLQTGRVVQLAAVRARKAALQAAPKKAAIVRRWSWPEWGALAATLIVGVVAGRFGLTAWQSDGQMASMVTGKDGALLAQGRLAAALSQAGATVAGAAAADAAAADAAPADAAAADAGVRIGLSFLSIDGGYCRSFKLDGAGKNLAGLACNSGSEWKIAALVEEAKPAGSVPMAGKEMPAAILGAIDQRISGPALDVKAEQEALRQGWRR